MKNVCKNSIQHTHIVETILQTNYLNRIMKNFFLCYHTDIIGSFTYFWSSTHDRWVVAAVTERNGAM